MRPASQFALCDSPSRPREAEDVPVSFRDAGGDEWESCVAKHLRRKDVAATVSGVPRN